jgi:hypothetical protein
MFPGARSLEKTQPEDVSVAPCLKEIKELLIVIADAAKW